MEFNKIDRDSNGKVTAGCRKAMYDALPIGVVRHNYITDHPVIKDVNKDNFDTMMEWLDNDGRFHFWY